MSTFKPGDKVKLISGGGMHPLNGFKTGEIYTVSRRGADQPYHSGRIEIQGGSTDGFRWDGEGYARPSQLELVTEDKFSEGDKVRVLTDKTTAGYYHGFAIGQIVTVKAMSSTQDSYRCLAANGTEQYIAANDLELVPAQSFAKGDKVVLKEGGGNFPLIGFENGKTYTVGNPAHKHSTGTKVRISGDGYANGYADASQLELAGEVVEADELQVGDVFIFEDPNGLLETYVTAGKEYTVSSFDSCDDAQFVDDEGDEIDVERGDSTIKIRKMRKAAPAEEQYGDGQVQVGDKIRLKEPRMFLTVGKVYEVIDTDCGDAIILDNDGDRVDLCGEHEKFTLVEKAAKPEPIKAVAVDNPFKVGDIIKGNPGAPYGMTNERMTKAEVVSVGSSLAVKVLEHGSGMWIGQTFTGLKPEYFSLVEAAKAELPAVGSLLKVVANHGDHSFKIGELVTVKRLDESDEDLPIRAERADGVRILGEWLNPKDFEVVTGESAPAPAPAREVKKMYLATGEATDTVKGKLYEIIKIDEDGDVLIQDESGDEQYMMFESEGKIVTVIFE